MRASKPSLGALLLPLCFFLLAATPAAEPTHISALEVEGDETSALVKLRTSAAPTFTSHRTPTAFVVDLVGVEAEGIAARTEGAGLVQRVRFFDRGAGKVRLVVELPSGAEARVRSAEDSLEIAVAPAPGESPGLTAALSPEVEARAMQEEATDSDADALRPRREPKRGYRVDGPPIPAIHSSTSRRHLVKRENAGRKRGAAARLGGVEEPIPAEPVEAEEALAAAPADAEEEAVELPQELAELLEEPAPAPVPAPPVVAATASATVPSGRPVDLLGLGFRPGEGGAQVFLRLSADVRYRVLQESGTLVLEVENARFLRANDRLAMDTSYFSTPVVRIQPREYRSQRLVRIEVDLREPHANYDVQQREGELILAVSQ